MRIEFLPEAKYELDDAVEFYELQVSGLGKSFKSIAKSTIKRLSTFPNAWTEIRPNIRRCIMHKFPYNVLYSIEKDYILIIAISHHHRNPNYLTKRLSD
jgi:plasmid stabilization system protein ParE